MSITLHSQGQNSKHAKHMVIIGMLVGKVIQLELVGLSKNCSAFVSKNSENIEREACIYMRQYNHERMRQSNGAEN